MSERRHSDWMHASAMRSVSPQLFRVPSPGFRVPAAVLPTTTVAHSQRTGAPT
jgi:hypothetical protein